MQYAFNRATALRRLILLLRLLGFACCGELTGAGDSLSFSVGLIVFSRVGSAGLTLFRVCSLFGLALGR